MALPEEAVFRRGESSFLLMLVEENGDEMIFQLSTFQSGALRNGLVEIVDGEFEQVLVKGGYHIWKAE